MSKPMSLKFRLLFAIPLAVIAMLLVTRWWYVLIDGEMTEFLYGFPLPFICSAWHTSMAYQIFIFEFILDLISYWAICFLVLTLTRSIWKGFYIHKSIAISIMVFAGLITGFLGWSLFSTSDHLYYLERPWPGNSIEFMESGTTFIFQKQVQPDLNKFHPEMCKDTVGCY